MIFIDIEFVCICFKLSHNLSNNIFLLNVIMSGRVQTIIPFE